MPTVTVSSKFQVVIPKEIRRKLGIEAGQKFRIVEYQGRIEFIPDRDIGQLKGFLKGLDTTVVREKDRS
jgi:AbrB family looped-hinge helix DNA binding protein